MKITNATWYPLIAFGTDTEVGHGEDVMIRSGESVDILGPYIGEVGGVGYYIRLVSERVSEIICHEGPDDDNRVRVIRGAPLYLKIGNCQAINVRHHLDEPEEHVTEWRLANPQRKQ